MLIDLASHGLFDDPLNSQSVVLDLGANQGDFSRSMIERFGCRCIAVEPSTSMCKVIPTLTGLTVVNAAVAAFDGWIDFHVAANCQASTVKPAEGAEYLSSERVKAMKLTSLLQDENIGRIDVLKIDIEGAEVDLFASVSDELLADIGQITCEFHDFNGTITAAQANDVERRLSALGFFRIQLSRTSRENVLFVNREVCNISQVKCLMAKYITRNRIGFDRWWQRRKQAK